MTYRCKPSRVYIPLKRHDAVAPSAGMKSSVILTGMVMGYVYPAQWSEPVYLSDSNMSQTLWLSAPMSMLPVVREISKDNGFPATDSRHRAGEKCFSLVRLFKYLEEQSPHLDREFYTDKVIHPLLVDRSVEQFLKSSQRLRGTWYAV